MLFYDLKQSSGLVHSLSAQIASELGRRIVSGYYAIGSKIADEATLANKYKVSRSVIRDAIKILVGKGLLDVRRGMGTCVRARVNWGLLDDDVLAWHQSAPLSPDFLQQLLDVRFIIEPKAAKWAAERGSAQHFAQITSAQTQMEQTVNSIDDFILADALFHRSILHAANNELLAAMEGMIFSVLLNSIRITNPNPEKNAKSIPFHRDVMVAIIERDGKQAETCMEILLSDTQHRLEKKIKNTTKN